MDIKEQVCSLEPARELKRLGVKQESYWAWVIDNDGVCELKPTDTVEVGYEAYAAFTVAELGEMLPDKIQAQLQAILMTGKICGYSDIGDWCVQYRMHYLGTNAVEARDNSEANARAKMLIALILNGYITDADWLER